jgi:primase-polymerase (primpol)-like protein
MERGIRRQQTKKVPYNPQYYHVQARASVKIPKSWGSLDQALTALQSGYFSGLGFVIIPPLVRIDLDHSVDRVSRAITNPQAAEIVATLHSYTETSPSGTGLIFSPTVSYQEKGCTMKLRCMDKKDLPPSPLIM